MLNFSDVSNDDDDGDGDDEDDEEKEDWIPITDDDLDDDSKTFQRIGSPFYIPHIDD